ATVTALALPGALLTTAEQGLGDEGLGLVRPLGLLGGHAVLSARACGGRAHHRGCAANVQWNRWRQLPAGQRRYRQDSGRRTPAICRVRLASPAQGSPAACPLICASICWASRSS